MKKDKKTGITAKEAGEILTKMGRATLIKIRMNGHFGANIIEPIFWPTIAPDYHSVAGWELEKKLAEDKIRHQLRNDATLKWFVDMHLLTGNQLYLTAAYRLAEIKGRAE